MSDRPPRLDRCTGEAVSAALDGSWRLSPPEVVPSLKSLGLVMPLLLDGGAGGLAWRNLRGQPDFPLLAIRDLRATYRSQIRDAAVIEHHIESLVNCLRDGGVEPVLIKGWASARCYADPLVRPYGDIDLCVPAAKIKTAQVFLASAGTAAPVDMHVGISDLPDRQWNEVFDRTETHPCGNAAVRVLGPEDHLRLICMHFVRHGGYRPLWLCDVAAAVEKRPVTFDWDYFLSGDPRLTDWALCVIALARRLLGAQVDHPAVDAADRRMPPWVVRTVLWRWGAGRDRQKLGWYLRRPIEGARALRYHGLNPIRFSYRAGVGPHSRWPLPVVQLSAWAARVPHRLGRSLFRRATSMHSFAHRPLTESAQYRPQAKSKGRALVGRVALFLVALVLIRNTMFDVYQVAGRSMQPTLVEGDRMVVNHLAYGLNVPFARRTATNWNEPVRGELVVLCSPTSGQICVKRVVGVPGDQIDCVSSGPVTVPAGHYFVLGDNPDVSADSRMFGCVDCRRIVGRVERVF